MAQLKSRLEVVAGQIKALNCERTQLKKSITNQTAVSAAARDEVTASKTKANGIMRRWKTLSDEMSVIESQESLLNLMTSKKTVEYTVEQVTILLRSLDIPEKATKL